MITTVLVIGEGERAQAAVQEISADIGDTVVVHSFKRTANLADWAGPDAGATAVALVVLVPGDDEHVDDLIESVIAHPASPDPRILLATDRPYLDDISRALDRRDVAGVVATPWTPGQLARYTRAEIGRWLRLHPAGGGGVPDLPPIGSDLLHQLRLPLEKATHELLAALEEALGPRPRIHLPAGVRISREDLDMDQLYIVVSGRVSLTVKSPTAGTVTLNHTSTGPIIGLLALTDRRGSMVTARTTTPCEIVQLTVEQLDHALATNTRVGAVLATLSFRALSARLRRAQSDRVKKTELAKKLQSALTELRQARADLVAQARMATLGELAAGIAHELNNPVAALLRSAEHLAADLPALLGSDPVTHGVLDQARAGTPLDARAERAARRAIAGVVKDPVLARRLVAVGVTDPKQARKLVKGRDASALERLELAAGIGASLQALEVAASHIGTLVDGLRQHARPDGTQGAQHDRVDVQETVHSALLLLGHRLADLTVTVESTPDLPPVLGASADLVQVWTNLVTNAADALGDAGAIAVFLDTVDDRGATWVRVRVIDDGPGVPEDVQPHVFEPRFTTKHGVVRFGLGLGLGIAHTIVHDHSGTIGLESRPGQTVFEVRLPALPPEEEER
ncbi:MAG: ATP-binding protein [Propionibacteriaceae bacterium]|nr:ATP-binding protein [Propionibacteriaceae bacterium]